jgi:capsular polysaccharide biosynthesis protein
MSGCVVALALALLSYVRISADGLTHRNPEVWSNEATLELSDPSYPELRSRLPATADPNRFTSLVEQYVALATSDDVMNSLISQGLISRQAEERGARAITASSVTSPINGALTPLLRITGSGTTPADATRLTMRATDTLIKVASARQVKAKIPESQRVTLRISTRASVPTLVGPRSKTTFIIILLAGLTVTVAAAFVRENTQRKRESETPAVFDRPVLEAQPRASTGSEPVRAAPEQGAHFEPHEAEASEPEVRSFVRTHSRARSSR